MDEKILTFDEVMESLQIKRTSMYKIQASPRHRIPFIEIGSRKIITQSKFYEWLHENEGRQIIER